MEEDDEYSSRITLRSTSNVSNTSHQGHQSNAFSIQASALTTPAAKTGCITSSLTCAGNLNETHFTLGFKGHISHRHYQMMCLWSVLSVNKQKVFLRAVFIIINWLEPAREPTASFLIRSLNYLTRWCLPINPMSYAEPTFIYWSWSVASTMACSAFVTAVGCGSFSFQFQGSLNCSGFVFDMYCVCVNDSNPYDV